MSLAAAKKPTLALALGGEGDESAEEPAELDHVSEIAKALEEKDWTGAAEAIAMYVDKCMAEKE